MPEISEDAASPATAPTEELNALPAGTCFDELEIVSTLAVGGFGIVYLAQDHALERTVAIKEYMPGQLAQRGTGSIVSLRSPGCADTFELGRRSFVNEARLLARFDHPSLLKVYRFWEGHGTAYMLMPYLRGQTLKQARQEMKGRPTEAWLRGVLLPLLDALELLHGESIYHRDVSPDNILLPEGGGDPILLDFGAARHAIGDGAQALTAILKPRFAPIEQYGESSELRQGPWTDLYALGAVAYYLILGHTPPAATTRTIADSCQPLSRMGLSEYSPELLAAIDWSLGVRPQDRPSSAAQMREALQGEAAPPPRAATAPVVDQWEHTLSLPDAPEREEAVEAHQGSRAARPWPIAVLAAAAAAVAVAGLGWWAWQQRAMEHRAAEPIASVPAAVEHKSTEPAQVPESTRVNARPVTAQKPSREAPAAARPASQAAIAGPADPMQECGGRVFIAREICLERQCRKPAYAGHPQCAKLREYQWQRERYGR